MFRKTIIALVGNDGAGKTYQATKIFQQLKKDKVSIKLVHFDHFFLKIPKSFASNKYFSIRGEKSQSIKFFNVMKGNKFFALAFPIVAYLDFLAFYLVTTIFSMKKIIIFDRYFYDKLIKFYDLGICNSLLFYILLRIIPSPDLTIYFDLSPEESFKRKMEMTIDILRRRKIIYEKISGDFRFIKINAGQEKEKIYSEIMEEIGNAQ